jgi:DNA primase catalytic subunit
MIELSTLLKHYKREDIQKAIIENAQNREIAIRYGDRGFGKRPDILKYPKDIIELAKQGATSLHASEELWKNPLQLDSMLKPAELDKLRAGWDLVLDIDCHFLEYSKIAADFIIKALRYHGIESISIKFSGNKGFHIGVPFEAFPEEIGDKEIRLLFPEVPRRIALYLKEMIKGPLSKKIMEVEKDIAKIKEKTGKSVKEITRYRVNEFGDKIPELNAEPFLDIDTILISSRHLYRMPYCFNEKSGLISLPFNPDKVLKFKREHALPEKIKLSKHTFLDRKNVKKGEAKNLIVQALDDFSAKQKGQEEKKAKQHREFDEIQTAIPVEFFPPCVKNILKGLEDGRKRSLFILTNFLTSCGWNYDQVSDLLNKWNKKNKEPLTEVLLVGHVRYHKKLKKKILPPNCSNKGYYQDMRVCFPDILCQKIKNPVNYSKRKAYYLHNKS